MQFASVRSVVGSVAGLFALVCLDAALAQTPVFTYQGTLQVNAAPANGNFDMRFSLHDSLTGTNIVAGPLTVAPVQVSNGLFTVQLEFGSGAFDGTARWLEIRVRQFGETNPYAVLSPRQFITATPYAIRALNAATASNILGAVPTTNLVGTLPDSLLSPNVALLNRPAHFSSSVRASTFIGDGSGLTNVAGRVFETIPVGSAVQAQPNTGYLATNDATPVVVTLPPTGAMRIGETVRVSASGAAGWIIRQNAGQMILVGNLLNNVGARWIATESSRNWRAVASSADGKNLVAVVNGGQIYTSTNYGVSWTARQAARNWQAVASSADGRKLVAVAAGGLIYTSTDGGVNWVPRESNRNWSSVASSLDGVNLVATVNGGQIFTSSNSGQSWTARESARAWTAVACSASGSNIVAVVNGGQIHVSTNAGASWTPRATSRSWVTVACSADGTRMVAAAPGDMIYTSADGGQSWEPSSYAGFLQWTSVASAADGMRLAAVHSPGSIYISTDAGRTWTTRGGAPTDLAWTGVAISGDASTVAAVPAGARIYVSSQATTTPGTAGYLAGMRLAAIELQYVGHGQFIPINFTGTISPY